ncbi:MAG: hypothetical protein J5654_05415 [Victivallales bacterium]|nr:hypothetical protein [Victivallales bacterium]
MNLSFFHSTSFGILALLVYGGSWCITGMVLSRAPRHGVDAGVFQGMSALVNVLFSLVVILGGQMLNHCSALAVVGVFLNDVLDAGFSYYGLRIMSKAMQFGPNGIIWGITQSCMIIPFLASCLFLGEHPNGWGMAGLGVLLAGLGCYGLSKSNPVSETIVLGNWRKLAFFAMLLCGIGQTLTTLPSYFEPTRVIPSPFRVISTGCGTVLAMLLDTCRDLRFSEKNTLLRNNFCNPLLWKYICLSQGISLPLSYFLLYPGINALSSHGLARISYPLMVGASIVAFTLASMIHMKEKLSLLQFAALVFTLTGLALLCI